MAKLSRRATKGNKTLKDLVQLPGRFSPDKIDRGDRARRLKRGLRTAEKTTAVRNRRGHCYYSWPARFGCSLALSFSYFGLLPHRCRRQPGTASSFPDKAFRVNISRRWKFRRAASHDTDKKSPVLDDRRASLPQKLTTSLC